MDTSPFKVGNIARRNRTIDADIGIVGNASQEEVSQQGMTAADKKIFMHFKSELTQEDVDNSQREIEESLKELNKSSILELRAIAKPH